jgi:hypothetical protein
MTAPQNSVSGFALTPLCNAPCSRRKRDATGSETMEKISGAFCSDSTHPEALSWQTILIV